MTQRITKRLIWWLLPLFALRGLVPAGFMIGATEHGVSMVICSGGVYKSVQVDNRGQTVVSGIAQEKGHDAGSQCPFAVAPGAAPVAVVVPMVVGVATVVSVVHDDLAATFLPFGPARTQQSRAPPYFS